MKIRLFHFIFISCDLLYTDLFTPCVLYLQRARRWREVVVDMADMYMIVLFLGSFLVSFALMHYLDKL